jgi:hypothetical protein
MTRAAGPAAALLMLVFASVAQADVVRTPISDGQFANFMTSCLLQGGEPPPFSDYLPAICCATNEQGTRWCVACYGGTSDYPKDCSVTTPGRETALDSMLQPAPGGDVVAPTPDAAPPRNGPVLRLQTAPMIVAPNN